MQQQKIAIIGVGIRFPGNISTLDGYFDALVNKKDLVTQVSDDRFTTHLFQSSIENVKGHSKTFSAGVLDNVWNFDYQAFGLSKKEVEDMDVQQRLCLMMTIDALSNANISPKTIASTQTAVFIGAASTDMAMTRADDLPGISPYGMTGTNLSIISNRLSYYFDLHGPSMTIDTACSSSLVALDQAVQYVRANPNHMAITGGVNILLSPMPFIGFSQAHMLSPDGRCKVFDDSANGYVRSEGGAILILKSLDKAIEDKDNILATIVDSKVNQDGKTVGISLPSSTGQQNLLKDLYKDKDLSRLVYVEAHGTGTLVGDPIEVGSIGNVLGKSVKEKFDRTLYIGSAKSNLGHLETASGMAGLLKAITVLNNKKIPASINIKKLNQKIDFDALGVKVVQDNIDLPKVNGLPLIGINSFGFGGTNAHVLIEKYDERDYVKTLENKDSVDEDNILQSMLVISAASDSALDKLVLKYKDVINQDNYKTIISTSYYCQKHYDNQIYFKATSFDALTQAIDEYLQDSSSLSGKLFEKVKSFKASDRSLFVFSGNGSQYIGMGLELYQTSPIFKALLQSIDASLLKYQDWSVIDYIQREKALWDLNDTKIVQPIVFALESALVLYLEKYGIKADGATGHSVGEVAAAFYCGALSLDEACKVIVCRSKAQAKTKDLGDMAVVKIDKELLTDIIDTKFSNKKIEIAAINTEKSFTLSGDKEALKELIDVLKNDFSVGAKLLNLNYPFHSSYMDVIKDDLLGDLSEIGSHIIKRDFYTATLGLMPVGSTLPHDYWWHNIRSKVKFNDAISKALDNGYDTFVEIGPRDILLHYVKDIASTRSKSINISSFVAKKGVSIKHELAILLSSKLFKEEHKLFDKSFISYKQKLPLYPYDNILVKYKATNENLGVFNYEYNELLGKKTPYEQNAYINELDLIRNPYLNDHIVFNEPVLPAASLINICLAASKDIYENNDVIALDDFVIKSSTKFTQRDILELKTKIENNNLTIGSRYYCNDQDFDNIVKANVVSSSIMPYMPSFKENLKANAIDVDIDNFYKTALNFGIRYQNNFRSVKAIKRYADTLVLDIDNSQKINDGNSLNIFALDGILQSLFAFFATDTNYKDFNLMLPSLISRIRVYKNGLLDLQVRVYVKLNKINEYNALLDCYVVDKDDNIIVCLQGVRYIKYAHHDNVLEGLFKQDLKPLVSLIETNTSIDAKKVDFAQIKLHQSIYADSLDDMNKYVQILISNYIRAHICKYNQDAKIDDLFNIKSSDVDTTNIKRYLLDFLSSIGLATYLHDDIYNVSDEFTDVDVKAIFNTLIASYPSYFARFELVCRIGDNLDKILQGSREIESLLGLSKDNVLTCYLRQNHDINTLSSDLYTLIDKILKTSDNDKVISVLELNSYNDNVFTYLENRILDLKVNYTLAVSNESILKLVEPRFETYSNVNIITYSDLVENNRQRYDIVINQNALLDKNYSCNLDIIKDSLLENGVFIGFDLKVNDIDSFIFNILSMSDKYKDIRLNDNNLDTIFKKDFSILLNQSLDRYNVFAAIKNSQNNLAITTDLKEIYGNEINALLVKITEKSNIKTTKSIFFDDFVQKVSALNFEHDLKHDISHLPLIFDFTDLSNLKDANLFASFAKDFADSLYAISSVKQSSITVLFNDIDTNLLGLFDDTINTNTQNQSYAQKHMSYALMCLIRTARNELGSDIKCIFSSNDAISQKHLDAELLNSDNYNEIVIKGTKRYTINFIYDERTHVSDTNLMHVLKFKHQGNLKSLTLEPCKIRDLANDEVLIKTKGVGLNYRDVMWSLGLLPAEALENGYSGQSLGLECSGRVVSCGKDVKDLNKDARVLAFTKNCFADFVIAKRESVFEIPDNLSLSDAASIPVAFLTAYFSIVTKANAQKGESILIHGGAGGVGMAAIEIAQDLGLEIYATAGTVQKRALLERLGVNHIYDSRNLNFSEEILRDTNSKGVDIVINSLYKEGAIASIKLLKPFGRFIELGKRDFFENNALNLKIFKDNLSFIGVDVDELLVYKKDLAIKLLNEILVKFKEERYYPLVKTEYTQSQIKKAFADMKASLHIGKIVVNFDDTNTKDSFVSNQNTIKDKSLCIKNDGAYVITGGMGGLGQSIALYLANHGAKDVYLLGRRQINDSITQKLNTLKLQSLNKDFNPIYQSLDVTDKDSVYNFIESFLNNNVKINGFYHAAVELHDAYINDLSLNDYKSLINTKVVGATNILDSILQLGLNLDFAVLFSSITTAFGNEGQANYVLANAYLESMALEYKDKGINTACFLLGPVSDVGLLKDNDKLLNIFEQKLGLIALKSSYIVDTIHNNLSTSDNLSICNILLDSIGQLGCIKESRFDILRSKYHIKNNKGESSLLETLQKASQDVAVEILTSRIQDLIASQLGLESDKINTDLNLSDLGIDSLSLMETMSILEKELEIKTSVAQLSGKSSIKTIALYCVNKIKNQDSGEDNSLLSDIEKQHGLKLKK